MRHEIDQRIYPALPARHIRVLRLHPGAAEDPLRATLCDISLDSVLNFEALSYTWGSPTYEDDLFLGEQRYPLVITKSLNEPLVALRLRNRDRDIWVDQVCINQGDTEEKSTQIQLMAEIYANANRVISWLGTPTPDTPSGMAILAYLVGTDSTGEWGGADAPWNSLDTTDLVRSVNDILSRPYFSRVWVVQEASLARRVMLQVGSECLEWSRGISTRRFLARIKMAELVHLRQESNVAIVDFRPLRDLLEQSLAYDARRNGSHEIPSLLDIAHSFRDRNCLDPRDKIYGVMGLVTAAQVAGFVPNYASAWEETYEQFYQLVERQIVADSDRILRGSEKERPREVTSVVQCPSCSRILQV
ncbi:heterokaryon incompatibility protein-domain-containing protein [Plectosphaerella plurivora]|uniref:Heterokaryon incompatibility protein-domain-containing protein n=1 Tax=Plectosphaerella plurivora TaxID=936078 RepID=A0A9P8VA35_9PEZI|nr:heterokaryon incompatibility protein-domain-containing protein [Plectosphaerella plurivora]